MGGLKSVGHATSWSSSASRGAVLSQPPWSAAQISVWAIPFGFSGIHSHGMPLSPTGFITYSSHPRRQQRYSMASAETKFDASGQLCPSVVQARGWCSVCT